MSIKVAFLNREPSAYPGGDLLSIADTIDALKLEGVEAEYLYGQWKPDDLKRFDLVHIRHINFSWSWHNFTQTWSSGIPYVVTPCFYPTLNLGMDKPQILEALNRAKAVLPFSLRECDEMRKLLDWWPQRVTLIPNGCSEKYHFEFNGTTKRDQVLCVAAREGDKRTDYIKKLCQLQKLPFTCATNIPHEDMPALYRKARVFVSASDSERMSRTTAEALCSGCRVLDSPNNWGSEWYEPQYHTYWSLADAYCAGDWDYSPNARARELTWSKVAQQLKRVYEGVLNAR